MVDKEIMRISTLALNAGIALTRRQRQKLRGRFMRSWKMAWVSGCGSNRAFHYAGAVK